MMNWVDDDLAEFVDEAAKTASGTGSAGLSNSARNRSNASLDRTTSRCCSMMVSARGVTVSTTPSGQA
jgi:hypothetical protein